MKVTVVDKKVLRVRMAAFPHRMNVASYVMTKVSVNTVQKQKILSVVFASNGERK